MPRNILDKSDWELQAVLSEARRELNHKQSRERCFFAAEIKFFASLLLDAEIIRITAWNQACCLRTTSSRH